MVSVHSLRACALGAALGLGVVTQATAQTASPDTIIVFDGSGSMWGQIEGRAKIEIARETLSSALSEVSSEMRIGMIAYGHREKGECSDIETVVPVGPAQAVVPQMIAAANRLKPKGKTPLSDAVRLAAQELRFTENAATVILVTDGIETCNADPCALGAALEAQGINFTAHVVGFGLSAEEGRQVQCLADTTGGVYLQAGDAEQLSDALRRTVQAKVVPAEIAPSEDDFGPAGPVPREVHFLFRDVEGGKLLGQRNLKWSLLAEDGSSVDTGSFGLNYPEVAQRSASATLEPGRYEAAITRLASDGAGYATRYAFEVPEGGDIYVIEAALSGQLVIKAVLHPGSPVVPGETLPTAIGGSRPRLHFHIFDVSQDGTVADTPRIKTTYSSDPIVLPNGRYLVRGNIDSTTSAEAFVTVEGRTEAAFSFDVTRVFVDARQADGTPVKRQTTYWYDALPSGRNYWVKGGGVRKGQLVPFYLPTGTWVVNVGGEGYGKRRSKRVVQVPGDFRDLLIDVGEGLELDSDAAGLFDAPDYRGCIEIVKVGYNGCLVERATLDASVSPAVVAPGQKLAPQPEPAPQTGETTLTERVNRVFGIVQIVEGGASIDEVTSDYSHQVNCQRAPLVIYPDLSIAQKTFKPPQSPTENPYKTTATGRCSITGTRFDCTLSQAGSGGDPAVVDQLAFTSELLGNNHYALTLASGGKAVAAACFFPGGELQANQIMPNGRALAELMVERADGAAPGMGYDKNNNLFKGD